MRVKFRFEDLDGNGELGPNEWERSYELPTVPRVGELVEKPLDVPTGPPFYVVEELFWALNDRPGAVPYVVVTLVQQR